MVNRLRFDIDNVSILPEETDSQFATARINAFSTGKTLHDTTCSLETLQKTAPTINEVPIIFEIDKRFGDFGTHDDGVTIPAGFIVSNSIEFTESNDGRTILSVLGKIWKRYSGDFIKIFQQDRTNHKSVSVEMDVYDAQETKDGLTELLDFAYQAVCVLGDLITPADPGAGITMLSFATKEKEEYKKAVSEEFAKYDSLNFTIPKQVKENARNGLDLYEKHGRGATSIALATGRHLIKNNKATPEKVKHMAKIHQSDRFANAKKSPPSDEYITYQLYGGNEGKVWSQSLNSKLEEIDQKHLSYFSGLEVNMPYDKISDINPALKGIDPPVSLAQANAIAKQADAIGVDKEKNGWAIAISSFKKTHKVQDGHWVEKAKMSEDNQDDDDEVDDKEEFASEDNGKGESVTVDKSKDSMSTSPWGNVDKTVLMHKVLNASNYKSLAGDVYAKVDAGWEDHPSGGLHYPIMQITGNKAVYNRYGLSAALQRAKAQNESGVVSKVEGIYKKMGLNNPEKEAMSMGDEEKKDDKVEEMAEKKPAEGSPEEEKKETPEEEKKETTEEQKKEEEKGEEKKMSLDANLDVPALLKMLADETDGYKEIVEEEFAKEDGQRDFAKICQAMYCKMCKMAAEKEEMCNKMAKMAEEDKAYMEENMALKQFKADQEEKEFQFAIITTMKEIEESVEMPKTDKDNLLEESKKFTLQTVDGWKNLARAKAFEFSKKNKKEEDGIKRYGLPWADLGVKPKDKSVWKNL